MSSPPRSLAIVHRAEEDSLGLPSLPAWPEQEAHSAEEWGVGEQGMQELGGCQAWGKGAGCPLPLQLGQPCHLWQRVVTESQCPHLRSLGPCL